METEPIQSYLQKLNNEFSNKFRYHYIYNQQKIIWDDKYNIRNELDKIKEIWKSVLFAECEKVIKSKANNENVNKDEFAKFYNEHFKQHENDWEINYYGTDLDFFFEVFEEETIDTPKKVDQLVDFIKNDLKPRNAIGDHLPILTILKLIKSNSEDDLFKILELNQQKNLSPYVLSECVSKFRLNCNSAEKLLSFGKNYELPDPKDREGIYRDEVDNFFRLLQCVLNNTRALTAWINPVKNLKILQKIFTYINKDMPQFKPFFGKINNKDKYAWMELFLERLSLNCIKIYLTKEKSGDGDIKLEIDYFRWFNRFVLDKLKDDNLDGYKENYNKFVSEFSSEIKKYNIEITEDIKKQLLFDEKWLDKVISQKNQMKLTDTKNKINREGNDTNIEKEIKNKDIKKIEGKNEIPIEINSKDKNKNRINEINEIDEKNNETDMTVNDKDNLKTKLKPISPITKITSSTDNQNGKASETYQKIDGIPVINNSKRENIQDQCPKTTFTPTTKISYPKLIAKIVLYALTVIALAAFVFSIIKAFWFLTTLSFVLCFCFAFIAYKIKYKIAAERLRNINSGYKISGREEAREFTEPNKNQMPETIKYVNNEKDKNNNSFSHNPNYK